MKKKYTTVNLRDPIFNSGGQFLFIGREVHDQLHVDEGVCYMISQSEIFREKVEQKFPGISRTPVTTWSLGQALQTADDAAVLSFGCRGGLADEHQLKNREYQETCAAKLFADIAGLNDPFLDAILEKVIYEDRNAGMPADSVPEVLKQIKRMQKKSEMSVIEQLHSDEEISSNEVRPPLEVMLEWVALVYEALYLTFKKNPAALKANKIPDLSSGKEMIEDIFGKEKAKEWYDLGHRALRARKARAGRMLAKLSEDKNKYGQGGSKFWFTFTYGRRTISEGRTKIIPTTLWMVVMETDNFEVEKCAKELGASVVIVKNSEGNMMIVSKFGDKIDLSVVALALRTEELRLMWDHRDVLHKPMFSPAELKVRGDVKGWPELTAYWYLHNVAREDVAHRLYNGSESASMVPPTRIPLATAVKIVTVILGRKFHPQFYRDCIKGHCAGNECSFFHWGLTQCLQVRREV